MRKRANMQNNLIEKVEILKDSFDIINGSVPEESQVPEMVENDEISINYVMNHIIWNQNEVNIDETFTYNIAMNAMNDNDSKRLSAKKRLAKMKICKEA